MRANRLHSTDNAALAAYHFSLVRWAASRTGTKTLQHPMSTQTKITDGKPVEQTEKAGDLRHIPYVMWQVGQRDLDSTEAELKEVARICREKGYIGGEGGR